MLFSYKAFKKDKIVTGRLDAGSQAEVLNYLKKNNYFPIEIKKSDTSSNVFSLLFNRTTFTDIVDLTRQLAIMLNAGLTLVDSFDILKKQTTKPSLSKVIEDIDKEIMGGKTFSSALKRYPHLFPNLYISLVKSGEASGKLSDILLKLADNLEKEREFQGKVKGALIYPVVIVVAMIAVIFIMVTFVIPKLLNMYEDFNITLPTSTQLLISVSSFFTKFWPFIVAGVFGTIIFLRTYLKTKVGRLFLDSLTLKIPILNNIIKISTLVDATRTLSILIASGVSILDCLNIIIETSNNVIYQNAFKSIYKKVERGISLGQSMAEEEIFPPILVQMTTVGENTGHLDDTLMRISKYFEAESEMAVKTITTLIEPAILVVLGLGVGFLVMAVITPIYNLTTSFK